MNTAALFRFCYDTFSQQRRELLRKQHFSSFEIDFEIAYLIYIAAHFDGDFSATERHWRDTVARSLNWSGMYQDLLQTRIDSQPSFSLDHFTLAKQSSELAEALLRFAIVTSRVDGRINSEESMLLNTVMSTFPVPATTQLTQLIAEVDAIVVGDSLPPRESLSDQAVEPTSSASSAAIGATATTAKSSESAEAVLEELEALVGLEGVKAEIRKLTSFLKIQEQRARHDLSQAPLSLHMVFTGNPGTGKTTVARLVARIFKALGILKKGHLVEVDRTGLVGQYVGHTEQKTGEVIQSALDGILFIDEAYALQKEGAANDFGADAIDALVKALEDHRERLVVIVAGYQNEMETFIHANPGLRSRFNAYIIFEDYDVEELVQIFQLICQANHYELSDTGLEKLKVVFTGRIAHKGQDFGNGRTCRNLFEQAIRSQALRLSNKTSTEVTRAELMEIQANDIPE
ncbi:MAG: AAA family ATPase [Opitutales bacterium]|nr:AAA family ATPase [Opitutales bacterium]NRA26018.1 AAA family ATPase [Opitutales bacterium]